MEALYNKYRHSLLNYLVGLLPGGRHDADEILHEAYIRLLKQDSLDHLEDNARAYIFTIATNLVRDSLLKRYSRCTDAHVPFEEAEFACNTYSPCAAVNWEESIGALKKALLKLKPIIILIQIAWSMPLLSTIAILVHRSVLLTRSWKTN